MFGKTRVKPDIVVAQDGSGDYKTVQEAVNAVPDYRKLKTVIFIKNGVYKEKLIIAGSKKDVSFIGEDVNKTIITFNDFASKKNRFGEEMGTSGSSSVYIYGDGFNAENITFENSSGPVGQAVALWVAGDKTVFKNCRMLGFQDTLYTYGYGSREYFYKCYIEGTVDFIFGSATAVFDDCDIFCKNNGYVTAASTPDSVTFGYVFMNCRVKGSAAENTFYLGRPWRPFAKVAFLKCELGNMITPSGWNNWGKESNEKTAFFAEYKNTGQGANPTKRVAWSHQLSESEAANYNLTAILRGWKPELDF
ncbi:pectinesterase family protein [Hufsiella arboris]|uniref:pectinesterase family protein n=1 Tax=Hufsiella arboris TaxID=2695275 RepID=UPI001F021B88|nr:pectinesterase family protein [Hufsiella arboris]